MAREMSSVYEDQFKNNFEAHYSDPGKTYEEFAPFYDYGYRMADDLQYRGQTFRWRPRSRTAFFVITPKAIGTVCGT